jgi:hypothetical protein
LFAHGRLPTDRPRSVRPRDSTISLTKPTMRQRYVAPPRGLDTEVSLRALERAWHKTGSLSASPCHPGASINIRKICASVSDWWEDQSRHRWTLDLGRYDSKMVYKASQFNGFGWRAVVNSPGTRL